MANTPYQSTHTGAQIDAAVDAVANKAEKANTLAGYGITDAYTKTEIDGGYSALYGGINLNPSSSNTVDLDTLLSTGSYYCSTNANAAYVSHKPTTRDYAFRIWVSATLGTSSTAIRQRFQHYNQNAVYERYSLNSGSSWNDWAKVQGEMVTVYSGSSAPSSSTGSDGDIYIQT